jgi:hypothetical protein
MSEVEHVALWAGLLASVMGIVLSVVAILFTYAVNKRADRVNESTIRSLGSIEASVAQTDASITGLVRQAWGQFLRLDEDRREDDAVVVAEPPIEESPPEDTAPPAPPKTGSPEPYPQGPRRGGSPAGTPLTGEESIEPSPVTDRMGEIAPRLERTAAHSQRAPRRPSAERNSNAFRRSVNLSSLSDEAVELLRILATNGHLTSKQYRALKKSELESAVAELKSRGLLVPLFGAVAESDGDDTVYWIPPGVEGDVRWALRLAPISHPIRDDVAWALVKIGYHARRRIPPRGNAGGLSTEDREQLRSEKLRDDSAPDDVPDTETAGE